MSLLDWGTDDVVVYPETHTTDVDGNPVLAPSETGVAVRARVQPLTNEELASAGYESNEIYRVRIARSQEIDPGMGGQVDWNGDRWAVDGPVKRYHGSPATARLVFNIRRA